MPVLTPRAVEVGGPRPGGERYRAGVELMQRLLLDGVAGEGGDRAIDQGAKRAFAILPRAAPAPLALRDHVAPFAGEAADAAAGRFLQRGRSDESRIHTTMLVRAAQRARRQVGRRPPSSLAMHAANVAHSARRLTDAGCLPSDYNMSTCAGSNRDRASPERRMPRDWDPDSGRRGRERSSSRLPLHRWQRLAEGNGVAA